MTDDLKRDLALCETDLAGAAERFCGDEELYMDCLREFLKDPTMEMLRQAIENKAWDDAFTAAHAIKGLAGNMGFVPLFHASGELVMKIRSGKLEEIAIADALTTKYYREIVGVIQRNADTLPRQ